MGNIFIILGILFLALLVVVPLIERFGKRSSPEEVSNLSRYILPLLALLALLQTLKYFFFD